MKTRIFKKSIAFISALILIAVWIPERKNNDVLCDEVVVTEAEAIENFVFDAATETLLTYSGNNKCVEIPSQIDGVDVKNIGANAFYNCSSVTKVIIPDSVINIGNNAFEKCSSLKEVIIPDSVTYIGYQAFSYCKSLDTVDLSKNVKSLDLYTFYETPWIEKQVDNYGLTIINNVLLSRSIENLSADEIENLVIPENVTHIGDLAFSDDGYLRKIVFPDSLEVIGSYAFSFCNSLSDINIPDSVSINSNAFEGCRALFKIQLPENITNIAGNAFSGSGWMNKQLEENQFVIINGNLLSVNREVSGNITLPEEVERINAYAFEYCSKITGISLPDNITSIERGTFNYCSNLKRIFLPESVTSIGDFAFCGCTRLYEVNIPSGITSIGKRAFQNCHDLKHIEIPDTVEKIGDHSFHYCKSLEYIKVSEGNKYYCDEDGVLFNKSKSSLVRYPACKTDIYYEIPDSVKIIDYDAFQNNKYLENIEIPDSVSVIRENGISECYVLKSISIPDSVKMLEESALSFDTRVVDLKLPSSVTLYRSFVLSSSRSLEDITVPDGTTDIFSFAFSDCTELKHITIPDSVKYIDDTAFKDSDKVTIYGHKNSYSEKFANDNNIPFEELAILSGDVTNDGLVNALDLSEMIKILILNEQSDYKTLKNSDINKDEAVNILDLILLKQKLLCEE